MNHKGIILISLLYELIHDGFLIQVQELNNNNIEDKIELKGANIYPLSNRKDTFIVMPIFPPVFYEGKLQCLNTNRKLSWFIDTNRIIYINDFFDNGIILKDGKLIKNNSKFFVSLINSCINFFKWLELEIKYIQKYNDLIQVLIIINDENIIDFPKWLLDIPCFKEKWNEYKINYKNLTTYRV